MSVIPSEGCYWLKNAHVPLSMLQVQDQSILENRTPEGLCLVDIQVAEGKVAQVVRANSQPMGNTAVMDVQGGQVWAGFVDMHTHLDKGHIWQRTPNPDGTFDQALERAKQDSLRYWQAEDVYRRMEFGLKCSYAHGTQAIRTHIDAFGEQAAISFGVFKQLQQEWANRLVLQAVALVSLDYYLTPEGVKLADLVAEVGGVLGGVAYMNPDIEAQLDQVFRLAQERDLALDFHVDETDDPDSMCLRRVAEAALRCQFGRQIVCGHCCSLAVQSPEQVAETLALVKDAGIGVVSLPLSNLYLQDRRLGRTPRWRGVTLIQELQEYGIPVALASDNCRDPFFGFGDHDLLEVFNQGVRVAHLDMLYQESPAMVTKTAADLIGLGNVGRIGVGLAANLVWFKGRSYSELLSRPQCDRVVIREGNMIDTTLPDYRELDSLGS
ncbi:MAG: cytosine deaminase [Coleofasciculus sp. C1-SOL-03]|jgi:cytosine deaminase|uniref:cytosine deaminase n=1 Tax=Coleofasciculus sp. C1-SOL-03 TaxID=3069522 RepID=UPI00330275AF